MKVTATPESVSGEGNDINTKGVRILTKVDNDLLAGADDYGYVVAKYTGEKTQATANFSMLTADGGNGQKVIPCKGSANTIAQFKDEYVTLAVNGMADGQKVVARFYITVGGVTYYTNYTTYDGIMATYVDPENLGA